jgi:YVTN family beta-propeller protein
MDTANNTILTTLYMGRENMISDIAVGNSGSRLFCSLLGAEPSVGIIDAISNSYVTTVTLPRMKDKSIGYPLGIATQRYGQTAFVSMGHDYGGEVVFINTITNAVQGTVTVGNNPFGIGVTPDGRKVYVANRSSANVSVIDVSRKDEICKIAVGSSPSCIAITPDGTRVFVTNKDENTVSVINTLTDTVFCTIPVGKEPIGITISRDGKMAFVANSMSDNITAIDVQKNTAVNTTFPFKGGKPFDLIVK